MSRSRDYIRQIALTLQRYNIISHVTDEMMLCACDRLRQEREMSSTSGVFMILTIFLEPDRVVKGYDTEIDNCAEGAQVVQHYARATAGEWVPAYVSSTLILDTEDGITEAIDFDFQGTKFHWQFVTTSHDGHETEWADVFYAQLDQFFEQYLQGYFFHPRVYEELLAYYLPQQAVTDLMAIEEEITEHFGLEGFAAFVGDLSVV